MVFKLVFLDFRWFSMVREVRKLKRHHLSTNLCNLDGAAAAAAAATAAATMTATMDLFHLGQLSVGFLCLSMIFKGVHGFQFFWAVCTFKRFRFSPGTFETRPVSHRRKGFSMGFNCECLDDISDAFHMVFHGFL